MEKTTTKTKTKQSKVKRFRNFRTGVFAIFNWMSRLGISIYAVASSDFY